MHGLLATWVAHRMQLKACSIDPEVDDVGSRLLQAAAAHAHLLVNMLHLCCAVNGLSYSAYLSSSAWEFGNHVSLACFRLSAYFGPNPVCTRSYDVNQVLGLQLQLQVAQNQHSGVMLWLVTLVKITRTAMRAFTLCLPPSGCAAILRRCSWLSGAPVLASQAASRSTKTHRIDEVILLGKLICR